MAKYYSVNYEICTHCAESGHSTRACTSKEMNARRINLRKARKKGDHAASNVNCPVYKKALEADIARTRYE
jgi:hypothetical protein